MKNEKMLQALGKIDDDMIEDAVIQPNKKKRVFVIAPVFRRVAATAACFALILGLVLSMPAWLKPDHDGPGVPIEPDASVDPGTLLPPSVQENGQGIRIHGLDQMSYYAAVRMIESTPKLKEQSMTGGSCGIVLLTSDYDTDKREEPPVPETTGPDETQGPPVASNPATLPDQDEDIYYYALDPNEPFYIHKVSMFQIELTDEKGFLASKLGLGIVDVVITEDCIWGDSLITFRRGENFFSCLSNGWSLDQETYGWQWDFSTHKYVEGFNIVKNFEQENHAFYIDMNAQGQAFQFICLGTQNGGYHPDQNVKVVSSTVISNEGRSFTVAELEEYFNTGKLPESTDPPTQPQDLPEVERPEYTFDVYSNGEYAFTLDSEGTFIFHHVSGQDVDYQKGTYTLHEDSIVFQFAVDHETMATISCELTSNGFLCGGTEYVKDPSLSQCAMDEQGAANRLRL